MTYKISGQKEMEDSRWTVTWFVGQCVSQVTPHHGNHTTCILAYTLKYSFPYSLMLYLTVLHSENSMFCLIH